MIIISFYVFGLPIGICLMFLTSLNLYGFWIGMISASIILIILQIIYALRINWKNEAEKAAKNKEIEVESIELPEVEQKSDENYVVVKHGFSKLKKTILKRILVIVIMTIILIVAILTSKFVKVDGQKPQANQTLAT